MCHHVTSFDRDFALEARSVILDQIISLQTEFDTFLDEFRTHLQMTLSSSPEDLIPNLRALFKIEQILAETYSVIITLININRRNHNVFRRGFMKLRHTNQMQSGLPREFKESTKMVKLLEKLRETIEDDKIYCRNSMDVLSSRLTLVRQ